VKSRFNQQFSAAFANSPVGMLLLKASGAIEYCNDAFVKLLGEGADDPLGAELMCFVVEEDASRLAAAIAVVHGQPAETRQLSVRPRAVSGESRWWKVSLGSTAGSSSDAQMLFALIEDVSEQKNTEIRLKQAKDTAERATKTKSAFLANMSHEIRTPLHTITGIAELLLDTKLDAEQREYGEQIQFSAEVLLGLINDILDFSKIEAGKLSLEVIQFDLLTMTEDAVDMVSLEAHKKGLEVVIFLDPRLPQTISGDPVRLRQIIVNLFNNAVKFTSQGYIIIRVWPVSADDGQRLIHFEVIDSGIGIARDKCELLFQAFRQVDSSTTRRFGGTGLGLSISKNLVEMMHGRLGVSSRVGKGSRFWFRIPLSTPGRLGDTTPAQRICEGRRLLIIDDSRVASAVLLRYVREWGGDVVKVRSGEEGIEALRAAVREGRPFDVALVDQDLTGMDGWQVASEVNADAEIRGTKLILLSPAGKSATEAKMKLLKWFSGYLNKPVKWRVLFDTLNRVLGVWVISAIDDEHEHGAGSGAFSSRIETLDGADDEGAAELVEELEELDEEETPAGGAAEPATGDYTVLVAEDHPVNQQLFETILTKMGYGTRVASDGQEAVDLIRERAFDLVFMDVQMPRLNGYEAARAIREFNSKVPIIAVTANAIRDERDRCLDAGMNDFLSKPFRNRDVVPLLRRWLLSAERVPVAQEWIGAGGEPAGLVDDPMSGGAADVETQAGESASVESTSAVAAAGSGTVGSGAPGGKLAGSPVFDWDAAVAAFMGRRDVVVRVVGRFRTQTESELERIDTAVAEEDWDTVRLGAHAIKGGARSLAAFPLGDAADELEEAARTKQFGHTLPAVERLRGEYSRFESYIDSLAEFAPGD